MHCGDVQGADKLREGDRVEFEVCFEPKKSRKVKRAERLKGAVRVVKLKKGNKMVPSRKRKLEKVAEKEVETPTKKRKTNCGTAAVASEEETDSDLEDDTDIHQFVYCDDYE